MTVWTIGDDVSGENFFGQDWGGPPIPPRSPPHATRLVTIEGGSYTPPPVLVPALAAWGILVAISSLTAGAIAGLRRRRH